MSDLYDNPRDEVRQELADDDDKRAKLRAEIEVQRAIRRPGTSEEALELAAINVLIDKGDY